MTKRFALNGELVAVVRDMSGRGSDEVLPGRDQLATNSLGIALAWRWARRIHSGPTSNLHVYAVEYENARGSHFTRIPAGDLKQIRERLHRYQFLTDVYIERWQKAYSEQALLAAEIEAYPDHVVSSDQEECDYLWDFYKLLYSRVPRRLFVACVQKENMRPLERVLSSAYLHSSKTMGGRDQLAVVLLPAGKTERDLVRTAWVDGEGALKFDNLTW